MSCSAVLRCCGCDDGCCCCCCFCSSFSPWANLQLFSYGQTPRMKRLQRRVLVRSGRGCSSSRLWAKVHISREQWPYCIRCGHMRVFLRMSGHGFLVSKVHPFVCQAGAPSSLSDVSSSCQSAQLVLVCVLGLWVMALLPSELLSVAVMRHGGVHLPSRARAPSTSFSASVAGTGDIFSYEVYNMCCHCSTCLPIRCAFCAEGQCYDLTR
mmetsp:Transcript_52838/g.126185  ORF Transcript_52838/g.126185 Transcript_52838/m.126185 type:complete len:210 (-) Transcript_52838:42-671(-)